MTCAIVCICCARTIVAVPTIGEPAAAQMLAHLVQYHAGMIKSATSLCDLLLSFRIVEMP